MANVPTSHSAHDPTQELSTSFREEDWAPWANQDSWDFEFDFWLNLAEHPNLAGMDEGLQEIAFQSYHGLSEEDCPLTL